MEMMVLNIDLENIWRVWCKALGAKEGLSNKEADKIALIRTFIVLQTLFTNTAIVLGVIKHWS